MPFEVKFSAEAESNVREIKNWISQRSTEGARSWVDALDDTTSQLVESANSFGLAPEADVFHDEVRQISFKTRLGNAYRALFVVRGNIVHVVSVRGFGQDLLTRDDINELP